MDLQAARELLGLTEQSSWEDAEAAWKAARKPLLKELNQHEPGQEPAETVAQLDRVESAFKALRTEHEAAGGEASANDSTKVTGSTRGTTRPILAPGTLVLARFEVGTLISHRPEGDTYRALDRTRAVDVALKFVDAALLRDPQVKERIRQSTLAARSSSHEGLARILDVQPYLDHWVLVQELPRGETLWNTLYGEGQDPTSLPRDRVLKWARRSTHALAALHASEAHGALRPESLWIADDDTVKVSDFGFSSFVPLLRERRLSRAKMGTAYWAPEQHRDDSPRAARSDQYALALCLYEVLSGKPSSGRTLKIRTLRRDYPLRFTRALERALSTKPARRFPDMDAFGEAAFRGYRSERRQPSPVAASAVLLPVLALLVLLGGLLLSPLGDRAADGLTDAVWRWNAAQGQENMAQTDWLRLRALSARLAANRDALDEAGAAALDQVRKALSAEQAGEDERQRVAADLTSILGQVIATSSRAARTAAEGAQGALDALLALEHERLASAAEGVAGAAQRLASAAAEERFEQLTTLARRQALAERLPQRIGETRRVLQASPAARDGWRALLEAQAALEVGDETTSGRRYAEATAALNTAADVAQAAVKTLQEWDPLGSAPGNGVALDERQRKACVEILLKDPSELGVTPTLARTIQMLRAEAATRLRGRAFIDPEGAWALEGSCGPLHFALAGTWSTAAGSLRLRVLATGEGALKRPHLLAPRRGEAAPTVEALMDALAQIPGDARATWCARRPGSEALPAPEFAARELTVRSSDVLVKGSWTGPADSRLLVAGERVEPVQGEFETHVSLPGDVLRTHVRAHGVLGPTGGPAALLPVRIDGLAPRLHLLEPALGTPLDPGSTVTIRAVVYDSTLTSLTLSGVAQTLRPELLYVVVEHSIAVPAKGQLLVPVTATDAAGNLSSAEWAWPVK